MPATLARLALTPALSRRAGEGGEGLFGTSKCLSLEPAVSRVLFRRFRRWRSFLWAARCRTARATNSRSGIGAGHAGAANLAIGLAISDRSCSRWGLPAPLVTEGAVRSYRTFSPVPDALR